MGRLHQGSHYTGVERNMSVLSYPVVSAPECKILSRSRGHIVAMERPCDKIYKGGKVKPKNCLFCKDCMHGYKFRCAICNRHCTYAEANLIDMVCKRCGDLYFGAHR